MVKSAERHQTISSTAIPDESSSVPKDDRRICYLRPKPRRSGTTRGAHFQHLAKHYASKEDMAALRPLVGERLGGRADRDGGRRRTNSRCRISTVSMTTPPMTDAKRHLMRGVPQSRQPRRLGLSKIGAGFSKGRIFSQPTMWVKLVRDNHLDQYDVSDEQLLAAIRKWLKRCRVSPSTSANTNGQGITLYSPETDSQWSAMGTSCPGEGVS